MVVRTQDKEGPFKRMEAVTEGGWTGRSCGPAPHTPAGQTTKAAPAGVAPPVSAGTETQRGPDGEVGPGQGPSSASMCCVRLAQPQTLTPGLSFPDCVMRSVQDNFQNVGAAPWHTPFPGCVRPMETLTHQRVVGRHRATHGVIDGVLGDPKSPPGTGRGRSLLRDFRFGADTSCAETGQVSRPQEPEQVPRLPGHTHVHTHTHTPARLCGLRAPCVWHCSQGAPCPSA